MTEDFKKCTRCGVLKSITDFGINKSLPLGIQNKCKPCLKQTRKYPTANVICGTCNQTNLITQNRFNANVKQNGVYRCKPCGWALSYANRKFLPKNYDFFKEINSELKAYLLGVIAGDGALSGNSLVVVAASKDKETLELFQLISPESKITSVNNCSRIMIGSQVIVNDILRHLKLSGPGKKSHKISMPDIDDKFLSHFVRGLIDTDGCINDFEKEKYLRCFYSSTSFTILNELQTLMATKNITSHINGIKLVFNGKNAFSFLDFIYADSTYFLSRKRKRYDSWKIKRKE